MAYGDDAELAELRRRREGWCMLARSGITYSRSSSSPRRAGVFGGMVPLLLYLCRWPRFQVCRFGWRVTVRFVRCMTHAGTRRLPFTTRNNRVFRARLFLRFAIVQFLSGG